jgi:hypothetical protein
VAGVENSEYFLATLFEGIQVRYGLVQFEYGNAGKAFWPLFGLDDVEKSQLDRRTNLYKITARGQRELDARREWEQRYLRDTLNAV